MTFLLSNEEIEVGEERSLFKEHHTGERADIHLRMSAFQSDLIPLCCGAEMIHSGNHAKLDLRKSSEALLLAASRER